MKKEINPAVIIGLIVVAVAVVGYSLWHAATDKPSYPGANAPRAGGAAAPVSGPMTPQQAAARGIPGVNPNAPRPQ